MSVLAGGAEVAPVAAFEGMRGKNEGTQRHWRETHLGRGAPYEGQSPDQGH